MAHHTFTVTLTEPPAGALARARSAIERHGGSLLGDAAKGTIAASTPAGAVKGQYRVEGQSIIIELTDKPFVVPWSMIESQVRKFMAER